MTGELIDISVEQIRAAAEWLSWLEPGPGDTEAIVLTEMTDGSVRVSQGEDWARFDREGTLLEAETAG